MFVGDHPPAVNFPVFVSPSYLSMKGRRGGVFIVADAGVPVVADAGVVGLLPGSMGAVAAL